MERLPAPVEELVHLGGLIHLVEGVSMSPLCVMVYRTVLVALMKWTVDPVRSFIAMNLIIMSGRMLVMYLWPSRVEIDHDSVMYFDHICNTTSAKGSVHTCCVDSSSIHAPMQCILIPPSAEALRYSVSNTVMWSKYATSFFFPDITELFASSVCILLQLRNNHEKTHPKLKYWDWSLL